MTLADALVNVIDDDISMLKAIGRLLESEDYSVELFTGAREFLLEPPHTGPSCVILRFKHARIKWARTSRGCFGEKGGRGAGHFHYGWCHRAILVCRR